MIDGRLIALKNGLSSISIASGSASKITTQYFGNEVTHDFDGDGRLDTAFILTQNTGGSGTFYYVVAALNKVNGYIGSHGLLLGDRIAPQTTEMSQNKNTPNVIVVNYADRKPGESFTTQPSQGKSLWLLLDPKIMQFGEVAQNFEGETANTLTEAEGRLIAEKSCVKGGEALSQGIYNENSKTWWYDANLNATRPGCSPACVVDAVTRKAEIKWRCTGVKEPVACTMDARQCPNGSYVGRTGPNCEFVCP
ncbi:MAG: hypothetical protein WCP09_02110 [Candidatus Taylorbacteria bacterium]